MTQIAVAMVNELPSNGLVPVINFADSRRFS